MNDDFIIYSFALKGSFDFFFSDASFRKISLPSKDASYSLLLLCNSVVYDLYGSLPLSLERQMCRQQKLEIDAVRRAVRLMPTCMSTALLDHLTFVYEQKPSSSRTRVLHSLCICTVVQDRLKIHLSSGSFWDRESLLELPPEVVRQSTFLFLTHQFPISLSIFFIFRNMRTEIILSLAMARKRFHFRSNYVLFAKLSCVIQCAYPFSRIIFILFCLCICNMVWQCHILFCI